MERAQTEGRAHVNYIVPNATVKFAHASSNLCEGAWGGSGTTIELERFRGIKRRAVFVFVPFYVIIC